MKLSLNQLQDPAFVAKIIPQVQESLMNQPDNADLYLLMATYNFQQGNIDLAEEFVKRAIGYDPTLGSYYVTYAAILGAQGKFDKAYEMLNHVYAKCKNVPALNWNYALALLGRGEFKLGWDLYRWRKVFIPGHNRMLQEEYRPSSVSNAKKTLLVWTEQGFGDQVMFFRFLRKAKERLSFGRVIFECPSEMYALFAENLENVDAIYCQRPDWDTPMQFDEHISLMNLPYVFGLSDYKDHVSPKYLSAPEGPTKAWAQQMEDDKDNFQGLKIGICWKGSSTHQNDKQRSAKVGDFSPLAQFGCLVGLVLEGGDTIPDGMHILNLTQGMVNAAYTASIIENLDIVVTVDTFVAHLAGAMGKKVFIILPYANEWRWGDGVGKSYWYEDVTLVKQPTPGDYASCVSTIVDHVAHSLSSSV
jgi:tetratricopeptide (TPR) repeat protein